MLYFIKLLFVATLRMLFRNFCVRCVVTVRRTVLSLPLSCGCWVVCQQALVAWWHND